MAAMRARELSRAVYKEKGGMYVGVMCGADGERVGDGGKMGMSSRRGGGGCVCLGEVARGSVLMSKAGGAACVVVPVLGVGEWWWCLYRCG